MPQLTKLTLHSAAGGNHEFNPRDADGGVATFVHSNGTPIADERLTISQTRTTNGRVKVAIKLACPVVQDQVVAGVSRPTVVRASYADLTFTFDSTSNDVDRETMRLFVRDFLGQDFGVLVVQNLEPIY